MLVTRVIIALLSTQKVFCAIFLFFQSVYHIVSKYFIHQNQININILIQISVSFIFIFYKHHLFRYFVQSFKF